MIKSQEAIAEAESLGWIDLFVQDGKVWGYANPSDVMPLEYRQKNVKPYSPSVHMAVQPPRIKLIIPIFNNAEIIGSTVTIERLMNIGSPRITSHGTIESNSINSELLQRICSAKAELENCLEGLLFVSDAFVDRFEIGNISLTCITGARPIATLILLPLTSVNP